MEQQFWHTGWLELVILLSDNLMRIFTVYRSFVRSLIACVQFLDVFLLEPSGPANHMGSNTRVNVYNAVKKTERQELLERTLCY